jgi:ATP-dependent Clp protease ATP-binding subunit ClpB
LQVLDDGRLTDNKGRVVNFKNTIIIMTSNLGSDLIRDKFENMPDKKRDQMAEEAKADVMELLRRTIRPEFLNRIDETIVFQPLSRANVLDIVKIQFNLLKERLKESNITIEATDEALEWLSIEGYDPQFGARPVKRVMQRDLMNQLSKDILAGKIGPDSHVVLDSFEGEIVFRESIKKEE